MTHGWPGSVIELLETVGPLTDPTAHGGTRRGRVPPGAAVHARLRLLRRADRDRLGRRPRRAGLGGADAPPRLHPLRRPGRRRGRRRHRRDGPPGTRGAARHPHEPARDGAGPAARCRRTPRRNARRSTRSPRSGRAASATSWSRPRGRRRSATPCWTHPSPWRPGCSTTTRTATTRSPAPSSTGSPSGNLTRDHILDNITLYWLTGTGASAARSYWESGRAQAAARPARLLRRSRSRSASPRSPARSSGPRAAGSRRSTRTSPTSTRPTGAATSPPGRSRSSSRPRCARRSGSLR